MTRNCESCGMPMTSKEDYGGGNINNKYCCYCTNKNGDLVPFEQKITDMAKFIQRSSDVTIEKAREIAISKLVEFPAWKNMKK